MIQEISNMPVGTIGLRASGEVSEEDYRDGDAAYCKDMWLAWSLRNNTGRTVTVGQNGILWARGVYAAHRNSWGKPRHGAWP
jgi:hypothetical protein